MAKILVEMKKALKYTRQGVFYFLEFFLAFLVCYIWLFFSFRFWIISLALSRIGFLSNFSFLLRLDDLGVAWFVFEVGIELDLNISTWASTLPISGTELELLG